MPHNTQHEEKTTGQKLLDFFEHPWFMFAIGIVATLLGFDYPLVLVASGIIVLLAFHRVGVVRGKRRTVRVLAYGAVFAIATAGLYGAELLIKRNFPHIPTAQEISNYIPSREPKPAPAPAITTQSTGTSAKRAPGSPFAFAVEAGLVGPGSGSFTGYWLEQSGLEGCTLDPIDDLLFLRLTNIQPDPKTVINYTLEASDKGKWYPLTRLNLAEGYMVGTLAKVAPPMGWTISIPSEGSDSLYYMYSASTGAGHFKQASVMAFPIFDSLIGGHTLLKGETVRGWAAFRSLRLPAGKFRIKITDATGKTSAVIATSTKAGVGEDVAPHLLTVAVSANVSGCTRKPDWNQPVVPGMP